MATDFTVFSRHYLATSPLDSDVKMLQAYVRNVVAAEVNTLIPIPWEGVQLVKAVACISEAVDGVGVWEIDLELNAAGGTEMMSITVAKSSAVGAVFEATVSDRDACNNLNAVNAGRDAICIESDGSGTPTGAANIFLIFEPDLLAV